MGTITPNTGSGENIRLENSGEELGKMFPITGRIVSYKWKDLLALTGRRYRATCDCLVNPALSEAQPDMGVGTCGRSAGGLIDAGVAQAELLIEAQ